MTSSETPAVDVLVVGDGVAGLSAALFTARHDQRTLVVGSDESILRRNAHLENFPGFPGGVDARALLASMREQAESNGATVEAGQVTRVRPLDGEAGFEVTTADGRTWRARRVVAATKNDAKFLRDVDGVGIREPGKTFVVTDERGRTGVEGLYAAGRLAGKPHQAVVAAGHGAEVGVTLLEDAEVPFYHDWVTPEGYFTGRGREVPPGCAEVDDAERRRRDDAARAAIRDHYRDPFPDEPQQHPSVVDGEADTDSGDADTDADG